MCVVTTTDIRACQYFQKKHAIYNGSRRCTWSRCVCQMEDAVCNTVTVHVVHVCLPEERCVVTVTGRCVCRCICQKEGVCNGNQRQMCRKLCVMTVKGRCVGNCVQLQSKVDV